MLASSPTFDAYQPGEVIASKYRLLHVLGAGGMGTVWLASNLLLEVDVAIKLLHNDFAGQTEASQRFLHEARATAKLANPAIVRTHDFGMTARGHAFIVMEHLKGEALDELLERRVHLPPIEAVQLLLPVLGALDVAHEHGVVHRDLKPENILLVREGSDAIMPKVVDFGVARVIHDKRSVPTLNESLPVQSRLTRHGTLLGSPQYMAPEQARGADDVDGRADIWGFCVCLFECIDGARPFDDESVDRVLVSVLTHEPLRPQAMDEALWQIVHKGLEKDRDQRWQFASDLGEALAHWLIDNGVMVDASGQALRSRWLGEASIADVPVVTRVPLPSGVDVSPPRNRTLLLGLLAVLAVAIGISAVFLVLIIMGGGSAATTEAAEEPQPAAPTPTESVEPDVPAVPAAPASSEEPAPSAAPSAQRPRRTSVLPSRTTAPAPRPRRSGDALPLPEEPDF